MKFLLWFVFLSQQVLAQHQVTGIVVNGEDGTTLASASVFINNSVKGTTSDSHGMFTLSGIAENNFELIISFSGFVSVSLHITPQTINQVQTIKLFHRNQQLQQVTIIAPEIDGWKRWGRFFTENFVGRSDLAKECIIENPEVLRFTYDKGSSVLRAYSNDHLIINNKALGYIIKYQLEQFTYNFKTRIVRYIGYTSFQDQSGVNNNKSKKWEKKRKEVYAGSLSNFMHALYTDSITEKGFTVHQKIRVQAKDSIFSSLFKPEKTLKFAFIGNKMYIIQPGIIPLFKKSPEFVDLIETALYSFKNTVSMDTVTKQKLFYFDNFLLVIYKKANESEEYLKQNLLPVNIKRPQTSNMTLIMEEALSIQQNGLFYNPSNLLTSGYWGWHKIAGMLPSDYILSLY